MAFGFTTKDVKAAPTDAPMTNIGLNLKTFNHSDARSLVDTFRRIDHNLNEIIWPKVVKAIHDTAQRGEISVVWDFEKTNALSKGELLALKAKLGQRGFHVVDVCDDAIQISW